MGSKCFGFDKAVRYFFFLSDRIYSFLRYFLKNSSQSLHEGSWGQRLLHAFTFGVSPDSCLVTLTRVVYVREEKASMSALATTRTALAHQAALGRARPTTLLNAFQI